MLCIAGKGFPNSLHKSVYYLKKFSFLFSISILRACNLSSANFSFYAASAIAFVPAVMSGDLLPASPSFLAYRTSWLSSSSSLCNIWLFLTSSSYSLIMLSIFYESLFCVIISSSSSLWIFACSSGFPLAICYIFFSFSSSISKFSICILVCISFRREST